MDINTALTAFDALSQETRLRVFRLLVRYGHKGVAAGVMSDALGIPHNSLSFHLSQMSHAGLVTSRREGRSIIYTANYAVMTDLIRFMVEDCCTQDTARIRNGKKKDACVIELNTCCPPTKTRKKHETV